MNLPWFPTYIGDHLAKTGHFNAAEHGAYYLLTMQYWTAGSLPNDDARLRTIARMTEKEWRASRSTLAAMFQVGWKSAEIEAEMALANEKYLKRVGAGRSGGKAKAAALAAARLAKQNASNATADATAKSLADGKQNASNATGIATSKTGSKTLAERYQPQPHSTDVEVPKQEEALNGKNIGLSGHGTVPGIGSSTIPIDNLQIPDEEAFG